MESLLSDYNNLALCLSILLNIFAMVQIQIILNPIHMYKKTPDESTYVLDTFK